MRDMQKPPANFTDPENRTAKQELQEQGVLETMTLESVKWAKPYDTHVKANIVTLGKSGVYLPAFITNDLGERIMVGTGKYRGRIVLLIKADPNGYKHNGQAKGKKRGVVNAQLAERLARAGAKSGQYEPVKITGGWMCEGVEK